MDKDLIVELKAQLESEKNLLEKELETIAQKDPHFPGDYDTRFPDFGQEQSVEEAAPEIAAYEATLPVEHSLELKLKNINNALKRIENNNYGICQNCRQEIDTERLKAIPEAETCLKCFTL